MWQKIKPYFISILIALGVGGLSALLTRNSMDIYEKTNQPPLSPPSILFPIVWSILFILMGISAAIIYTRKDEEPSGVRDSLVVYVISLLFNFFWSIIFFNMQAYLFAFIWLSTLDSNNFNHRFLQKNQSLGCLSSDTLPFVGNFCGISESGSVCTE